MSKVSNEQLKVIIKIHSHKLKAVKHGSGYWLMVSAGNCTFYPLATDRGNVREFKTFDAIVNHVSKFSGGSDFRIEFGGADE